jgi:hypothetical protein
MKRPQQSLSALTAPAVARALPLLALILALSAEMWQKQGSIFAPDWLPLGILSALLIATVVASGAAVRPHRLVLFGGVALLLLAGWTAASMAWSTSAAGARDEALLTGLYLTVLLGPVLILVGPRDRRNALALVVGMLAAVGGATALKLALAADPSSMLFDGRLNFPVSYVNACSALFALGLWPAAVIGSQRDLRPSARAAAIGAVSLFLALAITAQSKGTVLGLSVSAVLVFAFAPGRLRLLATVVVAAIPAAAAIILLTAPYRSPEFSAAHHAGWTVLAVAVAGSVLGLVLAAADRRVEIGPDRRRALGRAVLVLVAAGCAGGVIAFFASVPAPAAWASKTWTSFKHPPSFAAGSTHLTSLGSNRYDFWRVALDEAAAHPLRGMGGRGFYSAYLAHRHSQETPLRAHSLYLDVLSELGIPGLLLLVAGLGAPLLLLTRRLSQPGALAAFGASTYFLTHAAVDWIWTVPMVGIPAFLLLGIGCAGDRARTLSRPAALGVAAAAVAAAVLAFAPPWLAHRYVLAAHSTSTPAVDLSRARRLDPLSLEPYWEAWNLATTDEQRAKALEGARRVQPQSVAVLFQLALVYRRLGRRADAARSLIRAHVLDPREAAIRKALRTGSR